MNNIALIGAGQLGSRHLQALRKVDFPISIEVVDKSPESLKIARQRFEEIPQNNNVKTINYYSSIDEIKENIDFCIIATNADIRSQVTEELILKKRVKNILFEKILFQAVDDYYMIDELLKENKINAWVNCPRRYYPFYQKLKEMFTGREVISIHCQTGNSGIITGCIHLLDLLVYLNNNSHIVSFVNFLNDELVPTKRKGFYEVTGVISFELENGGRIILSSQEVQDAPNLLNIYSQNYTIIVKEEKGIAMLASKRKNWVKEQVPVDVLFQSNLTHIVARDILINNICNLASFKESMQIHLKLLEGLLETFDKAGQFTKHLPIT